MGTFRLIKKYSKPSPKLDEKMELLNKELEKTGMLSEKMTTSTVYPEREVQSYIPPTYENVPDTSGITGDSFTQPTYDGDENDPTTWNSGWNSNAYLKNSTELDGQTDRSIVSDVPDSPYGDGGGGIVITSRYFGTSVGYLSGGNEYKQVLTGSLNGGTEQPTEESRGFGGIYRGLTDDAFNYAVSFYAAYQSLVNKYGYNGIPTTNVKAWVRYNRFHDYQRGGEFATWTGGPKKSTADGDFILDTFAIVKVSNQYQSDPGQPYVGAARNFGDPDYYPGPVMNRDGKWSRIGGDDVAGVNVNYDLYNWILKTYGMGAAEWYLNNPGTPPASNPYLPAGAYVPLAGAIMDGLNVSPEATNVLISAVYGGEAELRRRELEKIKQQMNLEPGVGWQGKYDIHGREYDTTTGKLIKGV